jgi:hypothetical protein
MKMLNSVAYEDPNFNDNLETKPKGKGGRPKKQPIAPLMDGFPACVSQSAYFNVPTVFMDIIAVIDNLAELKVVMYILRHTWGFREFEKPIRLTIDEFMYGRQKIDGTRMDSGTGLSKSAVLDGLDRAVKHGFIVCHVDDHDRARVKHYYQLKMQPAESSSPEPDYVPTFEKPAAPDEIEVATTIVPIGTGDNCPEQETEDYDPYAGTIFSPNYQSPEQKIFVSEPESTTTTAEVNNSPRGSKQLHRSNQRTKELTSRKKEIRNAYPSEKLEEVIRFLPGADQLPQPRQKAPAFLRNMILDFSRDLGDHDHGPSNVSQAAKLYRNSGMDEEDFKRTLYEARAMAKRATQIKYLNSIGGMNRMPYFFKCLSGALIKEEAI